MPRHLPATIQVCVGELRQLFYSIDPSPHAMTEPLLHRLAIALGIGVIVGFERG